VAQGLIPARGDYIAGSWVAGGEGALERFSPRDFGELVSIHGTRSGAVDDAVAAARQAFPSWSFAALDTRRNLLLALKQAIATRAKDFAEAIVREVGKPLWEAETEVAAALNKIDVTLNEGLALVAPRTLSPEQRYAFRPHGVAAVVGPFNFPLHLVHGHVAPALILGNTVVIKPSELAPTVGQIYAECFEAAGFPPGVFNLVQGSGHAGAKLSAHPDVDVVMFTGSYAVGQAIKRATLEQPHKLLALELGGRNPALVLADCDLNKAAHDVLWGAYVTCGQRCSGTAIALVERAIYPAFQAKLIEKLARLRVGDPLAPDVFMGPLISAAALERYQAVLAASGATLLAGGGPVRDVPHGAYVSPTLHEIALARGTPYEREELFGPDLALEMVQDLDHAIARANESPYGLSASVFADSDDTFEYAYARLRYGCVNFNAPTCGASARLPFGGLRQSGNHRPAALFSTLYASYPVASIRGPKSLDVDKLSPGFGW
jgi:succinylglutamic semialdehyde dehydrogenase